MAGSKDFESGTGNTGIVDYRGITLVQFCKEICIQNPCEPHCNSDQAFQDYLKTRQKQDITETSMPIAL